MTEHDAKLDALLSLEADDKLDAETLVAEATDPAHPCHNEFEWDDTIAAHRHRLHQANLVIVRYRVTTKHRDSEVRVRRFTFVPSKRRHMDGDRAVIDYYDELKETCRRDVRTFVIKHRRLGDETMMALFKEGLANG